MGPVRRRYPAAPGLRLAWLDGELAPSFAVLLPVAVVAGTALAIANARADAERDAATGVDSVAIRLGPERAWAVHAALLAVAVATALLTLLARGAATPAILAATGAALVTAIGVAVGRNTDSSRREWAWEIEAIGVGLLGGRVACRDPVVSRCGGHGPRRSRGRRVNTRRRRS